MQACLSKLIQIYIYIHICTSHGGCREVTTFHPPPQSKFVLDWQRTMSKYFASVVRPAGPEGDSGWPTRNGAFLTIFIYFYAFFYVCLFVCVCFLKGALIHAWKWRAESSLCSIALYANCTLKLLILLRNHNHIISYHIIDSKCVVKESIHSGHWCQETGIMQFVIWSGSILSVGFGAFRRCISLRNGVLQLQLKPELSP